MALPNPTQSFRFKLTFDLPNKQLIVIDDTNYESLSIVRSTVNGLYRITGPAGIIYTNTGWIWNSFALPDTDGTTSDFSYTLNLPLDVDGNVLRGLYRVEYKVQYSGSVVSNISKDYTFSYQSPVMNIEVTSDNRVSVITSVDKTDYIYDEHAPLTVERVHSLTPPQTSTLSGVSSTGATLTAGPNIWTRTWIAQLISTFTYELDAWEYGFAPWIYINDSITGEESHVVESDDITSDYYACAYALSSKYEAAKTSSPTEAKRLEGFIISLNKAYVMYQWAKNVGEDFTIWANQIYTILQVATDCATLPPSDRSREVIPWASIVGGASSGGSSWLDYAGIPPSGLGQDGDMCIDTLTGNVYQKASGSWGAPIINIIGPTGEAGAGAATGNSYYAYEAGSAAVSANQVIAPFVLDPAVLIPDVGDSILITADITVTDPVISTSTLKIMNISIVLRTTRFGEIRVERQCKPVLWVKITRASSTQVYITTEYSAETVTLSTLLETGVINGGVNVQKSAPYGFNGDVVVYQLNINNQKKI